MTIRRNTRVINTFRNAPRRTKETKWVDHFFLHAKKEKYTYFLFGKIKNVRAIVGLLWRKQSRVRKALGFFFWKTRFQFEYVPDSVFYVYVNVYVARNRGPVRGWETLLRRQTYVITYKYHPECKKHSRSKVNTRKPFIHEYLAVSRCRYWRYRISITFRFVRNSRNVGRLSKISAQKYWKVVSGP